MSIDNQDEELVRLIREVLEYLDDNPDLNPPMERLLRLIPNLTGIYRDNNPRIDYQEAFNKALEGVSIYNRENISAYNLRRFLQRFRLDIDNENLEVIRKNFVKWFNRILKNKINDMYRVLEKQPLSLNFPISGEEGENEYISLVPDKTLTGIDKMIAEEQEKKTRQIGRKLWQYIEEDSEGILRNCHPGKHPNANCQELVKRLLLKKTQEQLSDIARELNVNYQTLNAHWKRSCLPHLQEIAKKFEYKQEQ